MSPVRGQGQGREHQTANRYEFKPGPCSSHSILMKVFPERGNGRRVLDLGCAEGYLARRLTAMGYKVVGIDRPGQMLNEASEGLTLVEADLDLGMPNVPGRFDFVLCADILEHLRDPLQLLVDLHSHIAVGGCLVASLPNSGNLYFRLNVMLGRFPAHDCGLFDRTHLHFYTWDGWKDLVTRGGFRIEKMWPTGVPVGLALPRSKESRAIRFLEQLAFVVARVWKTLFAYQFVVVARPEGSR